MSTVSILHHNGESPILRPNNKFVPSLKDLDSTLRAYDTEIHPVDPQYEIVRIDNSAILASGSHAACWKLIKDAYDKGCEDIVAKGGICMRLLSPSAGHAIRHCGGADEVEIHIGYLPGPNFKPDSVVKEI